MKLVPVMDIDVPAAADIGVKLVIVGACAKAVFVPAMSKQNTSTSQTKAGECKRTLAQKAANRGNIVNSSKQQATESDRNNVKKSRTGTPVESFDSPYIRPTGRIAKRTARTSIERY